jgi:conjugative transposon TraN protein
MEQLTINEQVTTVITASEPIRFVDISTDKVVGDQPINNTIRVKPKGEAKYEDGEILAIVTIVTERYRTQYALLYTTRMEEAVTDKEIQMEERNAYNNPAVSMSTADMTKFARQIWNSPAKIRNIGTKKHHMVMRLNNIYSAGDYFFIDFSIENKTNIRFDIDQIRMKLSDKKMSKATNAQSIEINPVMMLELSKSFKYGYRNVLVIKKMTFPNDKVLTIEMAEKQISGRNIMLSIDYEDVLSADSFNASLLEEE